MNVFMSRWAKLYSRPTKAELALEPAVASLGRPYRFQHPLWALGLFPDFALPADRVVLEVDDPSHDTKKGRARDAERTERLRKANWRVARCSNREALENPVAAVNKMMEALGLPWRATEPKPRKKKAHDVDAPADAPRSDLAPDPRPAAPVEEDQEHGGRPARRRPR